MHGTTFGGGPLVCATALEFLTIVEEEKLLANVRERGAELRAGLEKLAAKFDFIREVRGEGLILGIDLAVDGAPFVAEALRKRTAHQLHARPHSAAAAAVHHSAAGGGGISARNSKRSCERGPKALEKSRPKSKATEMHSAADGPGCSEVKHERNRNNVNAHDRPLTGMEWSPAQVRELFHLAADIKARPDRYHGALAGRFLAMIFEKPSLRTRVTFEVGIASLGGTSVFLDHTASHLGERESVRDVAKNLERWVHGIVARVFSQESLEELAAHATHSGDQRAVGPLSSVPGALRIFSRSRNDLAACAD